MFDKREPTPPVGKDDIFESMKKQPVLKLAMIQAIPNRYDIKKSSFDSLTRTDLRMVGRHNPLIASMREPTNRSFKLRKPSPRKGGGYFGEQ